MEALDDSAPPRRTGLVAGIIFLVGMTAGLGTLLTMALQGAADAPDEPTRKLLARLAWISMSLLGLTLLMLFWAVIHTATRRLRSRTPHEPTVYVDAWKLAGKRAEPEPEELGEDDDEPEQREK